MLPSLDEIVRRRKNLGLNQKELAALVGVSQSFVAKIEAKNINPSYIKTKEIFDTLENLERKREKKAKEIFHERVVGVGKDDSLSKAAKIMNETGYSQLPVFSERRVVGSISEKSVLDQILKVGDPEKLSKVTVEEVMEQAFPQVDETTPLTAISSLLQYSPAVLVTRKGLVAGIITKADMLKIVRS
jgi:predicted transcriptional regulator